MNDIHLPTARDLMSSADCLLSPDQDLLEAIERLVARGLAAAPVIDENGACTGMLTEKDCLRVLSGLTYESAGPGRVADFASAIPCICDADMDLFRVAELFLQNNFPVLPVEHEGQLIGTISRRQMLDGILQLRHQADRVQRRREAEAGQQSERPRGIEHMQRTAAGLTPDQLARVFGR
ncbi:MAG: CBS domain-containing protein [Acidobacteriota bacterium]